jgi:hypothetical protein
MQPSIEAMARALFERDEEYPGDRKRFGSFDAAPPEIQQWWRDRAERRTAEAQALDAPDRGA